MKSLLKRSAALLTALFLAQCAGPPAAPGDKGYARDQARDYRLGYHHGYMDGSKGRDENFERYYKEYRNGSRDVFQRGYELGYDAGRRGAPADESDQDRAYTTGYEAGSADGANGQAPDPLRHRAQFTPATERSFIEGYESGWHDSRER